MPQVFISYSRQDEAFVRRLAQALDEAQISVWLDVLHIQTGENWSDAIQGGLDACERMILVISEASMQSKQVANEWHYYLEEKKAIFPIRLEAAKIHYQLRPLQYIDFLEEDFDAALKELLGSLAPKTAVNPEEAMALEILKSAYQNWLNFERSNDLLLDKNRLARVFESLRQYELSESLWRFLLTSIAASNTPIQAQSHFLAALKAIESHPMIFDPLLLHPSAAIRKGIVQVIRLVALRFTADSLLEALKQEGDEEVILALVQALKGFDVTIEQGLLGQVYERCQQWQIRSQLLNLMDTTVKTALFVSDGTDLSHDFMQMAREAGFELVEVKPEDMLLMPVLASKFPADIFMAYNLVIIMKGEHFSAIGLEAFYERLAAYVEQGGVLFASSWVAWESKENKVLAEILPFKFSKYVENVTLNCRPTEEGRSEQLFDESFSMLSSCETLLVREGAHVLLEAEKANPIFGYCYIGEGRSFYLNSCQHSCTKPFEAQTRESPEFKTAFERVFAWFHQIS
jgi:hypothetical protein